MQTKDMISAYQTLNQVAEAAGVVLFGSTTAANLPLNELLQDFGVSCTVYNRSVEGLTIEQAESYIQPCIAPLMPKMILLHFGEEELNAGTQSVDSIIEAYRCSCRRQPFIIGHCRNWQKNMAASMQKHRPEK